MSKMQAIQLPEKNQAALYPYVRRILWGAFGLLVVVMLITQIVVMINGQVGGVGEVGRVTLAERGIAYVQNSLRTTAVNPAFPVIAILVAFLLGGLHALAPGHNKVLTGSYLVGAGGRVRHAIFIGIATALSHTITVIIIGTLALSTRGQILTTLYLRWLGLPSGLVVVGLGVLLLTRLLGNRQAHGHSHDGDHAHDHSHDPLHGHSHTHTMPTKLTLGGLVALALVHGVVPTTDALAVLLVALSLNQAVLGIALIIAYSLGIALVMSAVGILFIRSHELLATRFERLTRWMPVIAAVLVVLFGLSILIRALGTLL
jgi:ABC-type nickel/cobalt efflux system permease component RcnA